MSRRVHAVIATLALAVAIVATQNFFTIDRLLQENRPVVCFPIREYWLDIGKSEHYDQARMDVATGRF